MSEPFSPVWPNTQHSFLLSYGLEAFRTAPCGILSKVAGFVVRWAHTHTPNFVLCDAAPVDLCVQRDVIVAYNVVFRDFSAPDGAREGQCVFSDACR